nr:AbrB family transcriptional regulator [Anaerotalea alkaliphila]
MWIAATLAVGAMGGALGRRLRMPAGAMVGAILCVAVLGILFRQADVPALARPVMQIMGGAYLGHSFRKRDLLLIGSMYKVMAAMVAFMLGMSVLMGYVLAEACGIDLATALFSVAPGGLSDMALVAHELDADMATVSVMQLFRLFSIYLLYPPFFRMLGRGRETVPNPVRLPPPVRGCGGSWKRMAGTLAAASLGGVLLMGAGVPAGGLIGAVLGSGAFNMMTPGGCVPRNLRFWTQVGVGAMIGTRMSSDTLQQLSGLALPVLILTVGLLVMTLCLGLVIRRFSSMDLATALLCATPGGIQEIAMLSEDMSCDTASVLMMHTVRLVSVIAIFPTLILVLTA